MLQAMFSGVSGMQAHQTQMGVIGNNIANVNTVGFKAGRVSFQDQLSQTVRAGGAPAAEGPGGQNPAQVGLGVTLGSIDTILTQGNLQSTGKGSDLAIQGSGLFLVSDGQKVVFTRNGAFDLDSTGAMVNQATGQRLLGYQADSVGQIDPSQPITPSSTIRIPIGTLSDAKATSAAHFSGNLDASAALYSTRVDFTGNLGETAPAASILQSVSTVYDSLGNAHSVQTIFSNPVDSPSGAGVPAGATRSWDVEIKVDSVSAFNSAAGKSKLYRVGTEWQFADASGTPLGSRLSLNGGAAANEAGQVPGRSGASAFDIDLNYGTIGDAGVGIALSGVANGQTGSSPTWGATTRAYDSLGVVHLLQFKYTREHLGPGAPLGATSRWNWTATESGAVLGNHDAVGNSPLYFDSLGQLVGGGSQLITVTPSNGSLSPYTVRLDNDKLSQLASDATASVDSQDGYPASPLQSFGISGDGQVTGIYGNGQTRLLGQVVLANFSNPSGLDKIGNNLYRESSNSGAAQIGAPNLNGRGKLATTFLEMSNVDLSQEFTTLIVSQRGFQANTRIISVVDDLLQEVINLKR